jgi:hypothetical protein
VKFIDIFEHVNKWNRTQLRKNVNQRFFPSPKVVEQEEDSQQLFLESVNNGNQSKKIKE